MFLMLRHKTLRSRPVAVTTAIIISLIILITSSNTPSTIPLKKMLDVVTPIELQFPIVTNYSKYLGRKDVGEIECLGAAPDQTEDIFCLQRAKTLRNYKNPCWKDANETLRCLPYFHLGTSKCGSTDLFHRVKQHPDVLGCSKCHRDGKATQYWAWKRYGFTAQRRNVRKQLMSFSQYINMFNAAAKKIEGKRTNGYHEKIIGDGSPMDFWDFRGWTQIPQNRGLEEPEVLTPHLMRHLYTDFRMVLILRNPVDRLYSDYFFLRQGHSPGSFHRDAITSINMMRKCLSNHSVAACFFSHDLYYKLPTRIHIGCYSVFLKVWLSVFPRENFLFLRTEDYKESPGKTLMIVFDFLNLGSLDADEFESILKSERQNETPWKKKAPPMFNSTRILLSEFYAQYTTELAGLLKDERFKWCMHRSD